MGRTAGGNLGTGVVGNTDMAGSGFGMMEGWLNVFPHYQDSTRARGSHGDFIASSSGTDLDRGGGGRGRVHDEAMRCQ